MPVYVNELVRVACDSLFLSKVFLFRQQRMPRSRLAEEDGDFEIIYQTPSAYSISLLQLFLNFSKNRTYPPLEHP